MFNPPSTQKRPVKVAFFSRELGFGGAERWIISLATNFLSARPVGLALRHNSWVEWGLLNEAMRVMPVYRNDSNDLHGAKHALNKACEQADVVICWGIEDLQSFKTDLHIPVVDVMHCADDLHSCIAVQAKASTMVADYVACVTAATISAVPERARGKVKVIHNGADPTRCAPRLGREKTRQMWRMNDDEKMLLFIGRFSEEKNPDSIIGALAALPSHWRAVMAGPDCGMKGDVQRMASMIAPKRCWFPPVSSHIGDLLAAADVLCVPSRSEGHCLVVNEAWISGLPVVTCSYEAMREFDGLHGSLCWLVPVGADALAIADAIEEADSNGRSCERVLRAREIAWNLYTTSSMAARWEEYLINEVLPDWYSHALYAPLSTI